jgi:hypothetical protein
MSPVAPRDEHRLKVYENGVLGRMFGATRKDVAGSWRRQLDEEVYNLHVSPDVVSVMKPRRMRWARHVELMGEKGNVCKIFVGKPEGKRPLGRSRCRWEDNIKMYLRERG